MNHEMNTDTDLDALEFLAGETAQYLMNDGQDFLQGFVEVNDHGKPSAADAILIVGFALLKQRERHYEERLSARPDDASDEQRQHDYDWLKWLVEKAMPNMSEGEHGDAIARIVRLAGV
jgi:hypothetical protein